MKRRVVLCTPVISSGAAMQAYVDQQVQSTKKQWIYDIIQGRSEGDTLLLDTPDFVLLPDTGALNSTCVINWLAIFKDTSLKSIRSLTGAHLQLLKDCKRRCSECILQNTDFGIDDVLAYFHYLPSVFQLHVHFCAPYGKYTTHDICKIHTIDNVISNLEIDPLYYQKVSLTTVVIGNGELSAVYAETSDK